MRSARMWCLSSLAAILSEKTGLNLANQVYKINQTKDAVLSRDSPLFLKSAKGQSETLMVFRGSKE